MSLTLTQAVWDRSQQRGAALLVLLALAEYANRQGLAWPRLDVLAARARLSRRHCTAVLRVLITSGEIAIERLPGDRRRRLYRLEAFLDDSAAGEPSQPPSGTYRSPPGVDPRLRAEWDAIGRRPTPPPFQLDKRLDVLADLLPSELPERSRWQQRVLALDGDLQQVEDQLERIELELLDQLAARLEPEKSEQLHQRAAAALQRHRSRLTEADLERQQARLLRRFLREHFRLPRLSLFAPQVEDALTR